MSAAGFSDEDLAQHLSHHAVRVQYPKELNPGGAMDCMIESVLRICPGVYERYIGQKCVHLYSWSRSECQWAKSYASVTGEFEWYFW